MRFSFKPHETPCWRFTVVFVVSVVVKNSVVENNSVVVQSMFLDLHFGGAVDRILAARRQLQAQPARATALLGLEEQRGLGAQAEAHAGLQPVEGQGRGLGRVARLEAPQGLLGLAAGGTFHGHPTRKTRHQGLHLLGEERKMLAQQTAVLPLPLVAVGLHGVAVAQMRLQVRRLVEEDPQETVRSQVAVDGNLVERMVAAARRLRPAVVAELRATLSRDMEMHLVKVQIAIHPVHRPGRQVVGQNPSVPFFRRHSSNSLN